MQAFNVVYGQTKLEGELAVNQTLESFYCPNCLGFGLNGKNFIKTISVVFTGQHVFVCCPFQNLVIPCLKFIDLAKLRFGINASYIAPVLFMPSSPLCSCAK